VKKIIPAIDLYNGEVVRLHQGDFKNPKIYHKNPIELLRNFLSLGVGLVHVVNLNGAKSGHFKSNVNFKIIQSLIEEANKWGSKIQLGGGIRAIETIDTLLDIGLHKFIIGTIAVENPTLLKNLIRKYKDQMIVALDVLNGQLKTKGWTKESNKSLDSHFLKLEDQGVSHFIITDISRDGTLNGINRALYKKMSSVKQDKTKIIASGGIVNESDIHEVLQYTDGVIIGKALYRNKISSHNLQNLIVKYKPSNLTKRIIPCLDVKNGRVVKGIRFINLKDSGDPVELAKFYNDEGADELVFLDISATIEGRKSMLNTIRSVAEEVYIPLTVGGGIKSIDDMTAIIKAGAEKVSINSAAINDPTLITRGAKKFGSQCIVVAIDAKRKDNSWEVYSHSGTKSTGLDVLEWTKLVVDKGAGELLVTSMDRDGTNLGYDLDLIRAITNAVSVPVIASGGAGNKDHFIEAINNGAEAVLAASLFHYKVLRIKDLKEYMGVQDVLVRL
jgi:cyclase